MCVEKKISQPDNGGWGANVHMKKTNGNVMIVL